MTSVTIFEKGALKGQKTYDISLGDYAARSLSPEFDFCFFDFDTGFNGFMAETITAFDVSDYFTHSDPGIRANSVEQTASLPFNLCSNVRCLGSRPQPRAPVHAPSPPSMRAAGSADCRRGR